VRTSDRERAQHAAGKSFADLIRTRAGRLDRAPDAVIYPGDADAVAAALRVARERALAVVPFGGGTSVVGGVESGVGGDFQGVISLDLRGLDRVLELDLSSRTARIAAGASGPVLEEQLEAHGLTARFFPQSFEHSTLGGWVATRAGGHFATLYTHIDDILSSARMITPTGVWQSRTLPASGAGPSPDRLILGSEGTFGVITEATVRLQTRPQHRAKANMTFDSFSSAVAATRAIAQSGLYPSNCRLLDEREAQLFSVGTKNTLLLAFESADHPVDAWIERAKKIAEEHGGEGAIKADEAWKSAFFDAPYMQSMMISLGLVADTFETACTWSRFEELHQAIINDVRAAMKRVAGKGRISCRFTHVYPDGPAPYYTFLAPARRGAELEQWAEIKKAASDAINRHGGTITHHHAVGRTHRPWYEKEVPEPFLRALAAAKKAIDPALILNPGVLLKTTA
jgi:alkyldihydroxyacetonephosphate synthase